MRPLFLFLFLLINATASAQFTDRYWVFGDSAGIDFSNLSNPVAANSILRAKGTCASICDSVGNLLFYCGAPNWYRYIHGIYPAGLGYAINNQNLVISNGDSLKGIAWYQEMAIVPDPGNSNNFYVFGIGVASDYGLYYSKLDLSMNGGLGYMVQKNVQLNLDTLTDCIATVKHGNGRDWWLVIRDWKPFIRKDEIFVYLIDPTGVTAIPVQHLFPIINSHSANRMKFSKDGNHLYNINPYGYVQRYDFDRCTGQFSNPVIYADSGGVYSGFFDFDVSASEQKMYANAIYQGPAGDLSYILQFDLTNPTNFAASCDTIGTFYNVDAVPGAVKRGPDDKIYVTALFQYPDTCYNYLYCASTSFIQNTHLSVVPYPDSTGAACGYQNYNFSLGFHKAYWGLPNNPNYELDTLHGSPCDTLTSVGLNDIELTGPKLHLYYHPDFKTLYVNADHLRGTKGVVEFYSSSGQLLETINTPVRNGDLTYSSSFALQPSGTYLVKIKTEKEMLSGKFVK